MSFAPSQPLPAALRRKLDTLRNSGPQVHHVADLSASGGAAGGPGAAMRSERLTTRGFHFDDTIFGGPRYRLSSRHPYQESPLAWLSASSPASYITEVEHIVWTQPRDPGNDRGFLQCHFEEPPRRRSVAVFAVSALPWSGATGHLTLKAHAASISIPVTQSLNHAIEIVFDPPATGPIDVGIILEAGIQLFAFQFMTLGPAPLVISADI